MLSSRHDDVALNHTPNILILLSASTPSTGHDLCLCALNHIHLVLLMLMFKPGTLLKLEINSRAFRMEPSFFYKQGGIVSLLAEFYFYVFIDIP